MEPVSVTYRFVHVLPDGRKVRITITVPAK